MTNKKEVTLFFGAAGRILSRRPCCLAELFEKKRTPRAVRRVLRIIIFSREIDLQVAKGQNKKRGLPLFWSLLKRIRTAGHAD
jgi:hypothetical protein